MKNLCLPTTLLLALSFAAGCGPASDSKEQAGPPVAERLEKAKDLLEQARTAGADKIDPQDFVGQEKKLDDAQKAIDDGKPDRAKSKIRSAEAGLKELVTKVETLKKSRDTGLAEKKKAQKAMADAVRAKAEVGNKEAFEEIRALMAQTDAELDGSNLAKVTAAPRNYQRIQEMIVRVKQDAGETMKWKQKADEEKKACLETEGKAREAKAPELVLQDFNQAQGYFRDAEADYKQDRFQQAYDGYRAAQNAYVGAITQAKAVSEAMAQGNQPPTPGDAAPATANVVDSKKAAPAPPTEEPTPAVEPVEPGPGELSAEDELFLSENWKSLCNKASPSYDPGSGTFEVDYPFGDILRRDIVYPRGPIPDKHIAWKDIVFGMDSKKAEGKKELGITFHGNTSGFFCFPIPFKETLELEYRVQIATMRNDGSLTTLLMCSPNGKDYIGCNFGTVEIWLDGYKKGTTLPGDPAQKRSANYWFSKTRDAGVLMKLTLEPHEDGKSSTVKIWYDMDEEPDNPITVAKVPARSGMVGFNWFMTKFNIRELKIKGKLDKETAVKMLRAKLKPGGAVATGSAGKAPPKAKTVKEKTADEEKESDTGASSTKKQPAGAKGKADY